MVDLLDTGHIILKLLVSLVSIIGMLRWMGRKEMKQQTPLHYCLLVILGGVVSIITTGSKYNSLELIIIIVAWFFMIYIVDYFKSKSGTVRHLVQANPIVIIHDGKVLREVLEQERMSEDEMRMELRTQGVFDVKEVKIAVLEISGRLSVLKK